MAVPFWKLKSPHQASDGSERKCKPSNKKRNRKRARDEDEAAVLALGNEIHQSPMTHPVVQRRNLTYIKLAKDYGKASITNATDSYAFHILRQNRRSADSALIKDDYKCPLCRFETLALPNVWIHLNTHHSHKYSFQHKTTPDGRLHILVKPLVQHESQPPPPKGESELIYIESRCRYQNCTLKGTATLVDLITMPPRNDAFPLPERPYYHPETGCVLTLGQWLHGTENEAVNNDWRRELEEEMIDEFIDVSPPEKAFFKLWNAFLGDGYVLPLDLVPRLAQFVESHAKRIHDEGLYYELLAHLMNMWDHGHLGREAMHALCLHYSELIAPEAGTETRKLVCMSVSNAKREISQAK